jgi:hypothetical protein
VKKNDMEIIPLYQMVGVKIEFIVEGSALAARSPQIWPHLPAFLFRALL